METPREHFCEETGEEIGIPRLLARPTATLCIDAKDTTEQIQAPYRDSQQHPVAKKKRAEARFFIWLVTRLQKSKRNPKLAPLTRVSPSEP